MGQSLKKNISLAGTGRGNLESYCYRAQRKGMKRDCFIPDCISFIHSFTLYGRFLRSDWESLLEGGCTSLAVPYPAGRGTGHCCHCEHRVGLGGCREETTTEEAFKSVLFSLKKTQSASLTFNKIRGIKEGNNMP